MKARFAPLLFLLAACLALVAQAAEHCPHCGGTLKIIAAIEHPPVIAKNLTHLGLSARAPPRSPARLFELFQMA